MDTDRALAWTAELIFSMSSEAFDGERKRRPRESEPTPNNLTLYKFRMPFLDGGEERDLLRAAKQGDAHAKDRLARCFQPLVMTIASEYFGPSREDRIATCWLGLGKAITRFDLRWNIRFSSYAQEVIRNELRAEVKFYRKRGQHGETREERLFSG